MDGASGDKEHYTLNSFCVFVCVGGTCALSLFLGAIFMTTHNFFCYSPLSMKRFVLKTHSNPKYYNLPHSHMHHTQAHHTNA